MLLQHALLYIVEGAATSVNPALGKIPMAGLAFVRHRVQRIPGGKATSLQKLVMREHRRSKPELRSTAELKPSRSTMIPR